MQSLAAPISQIPRASLAQSPLGSEHTLSPQKTLPLRPLSLSDKPIFDRYLALYPQRTCEMTFANMFCWNSVVPHFFTELDDHLVIAFVGRDKKKRFMQPIGQKPSAIILKLIEDYGITSWSRVDERIAPSAEHSEMFAEDRNNWDYVYSLSELRLLKGKKWHNKQRLIRRCQEHNPVTMPLDKTMFQQCAELSRYWLLEKKCLTEADTVALATSLKYFKELQLMGVAIFVQGSLEAFAIGEGLNPTTFVFHFMKANAGCNGLYQYTFQECIRHIPDTYSFVNLEQDLGIDGLRQAKESWYPFEYVRKHSTLSV